MTAAEFKKFIARKLNEWATQYQIGDISTKCSTPFTKVDPSSSDFWAPPEDFRKDLYDHYNVTPTLPSLTTKSHEIKFLI